MIPEAAVQIKSMVIIIESPLRGTFSCSSQYFEPYVSSGALRREVDLGNYLFLLTSIKQIHCLLYCCHCPITSSCLTLHYPRDCSTPGLPVPHHLPKFVQVQVSFIRDAIQLSHPLLPSSPSAFSLSRHQVFFFFPPVSGLFSSGYQSTGASALA